MEFSDFLNALNLMLGDTNNFALSVDEKTANLEAAYNDQYAITEVWDSSSVVFSVSSYQYPVPTTMTVVWEIYLERDSDLNPEPIATELWEQIAGQIQFTPRSQWRIPDQSQLFIKGGYKVTINDTVSDVGLQNYILAVACWNCLRNLAFTKLLSFLRNDSTIPDILNLKKDARADMQEYRNQLQTRFISS
jgi:hypothetical protein